MMVNPHDIAQVQAETGMAPVQAYYHLQGRAALRNLHAQQVRAAASLAVDDAYGVRMADLQQAVAGPASESAVLAALTAADEYRARIAELERAVDNLKASNIKLRLAGEQDALKAALIDHVLHAEDSHLVLCEAQYLPAQRRWTFSPLSDLAEAQAVMDRDIDAALDADEAECHACAGTGEGQHEGASCAVCGGRGH